MTRFSRPSSRTRRTIDAAELVTSMRTSAMIGAPRVDSIRSMATPKPIAWIKPWMVLAALTVVAAGGATAVYFAGEAQHRHDRADIVAWEARALPAARDASAVRDQLRATMPAEQIAEARARLDH